MDRIYPSVLRRYLAALTDFLVPFVSVVVAAQAFERTFPSISVNPIVFAVVFLLYEPVFSSLGATLGQVVFRFRVRVHTSMSQMKLWQGYVRYFAKIFLGWVSLLTIPGRKDGKALHDLLVGTIVVEAKNA